MTRSKDRRADVTTGGGGRFRVKGVVWLLAASLAIASCRSAPLAPPVVASAPEPTPEPSATPTGPRTWS